MEAFGWVVLGATLATICRWAFDDNPVWCLRCLWPMGKRLPDGVYRCDWCGSEKPLEEDEE